MSHYLINPNVFWTHYFISHEDKKKLNFEKSNNFNNLDIYAMVLYFIVYFNS